MDADVVDERSHLLALAYRMLGTIAEAEDAVQETYARWYRMTPEERDAIDVPRAWLTRVASRVCLDVLDSARVRHERYVGPWLPEPLPAFTLTDSTSTDPLDRVTLDDSVSTALLIVLESMTPAERVVFILHDVFAVPFAEIADTVGRSAAACRQLATSARRRVERSRAGSVSRREHDAAVRAFAAAARSGDLHALVNALDPKAVLLTDGGGTVTAARNSVVGADRVARFLLGVQQKTPGAEVLERETADGLGLAVRVAGQIIAVATLGVAGAAVSEVRIVLNPAKLSLWNHG